MNKFLIATLLGMCVIGFSMNFVSANPSDGPDINPVFNGTCNLTGKVGDIFTFDANNTGDFLAFMFVYNNLNENAIKTANNYLYTIEFLIPVSCDYMYHNIGQNSHIIINITE